MKLIPSFLRMNSSGSAESSGKGKDGQGNKKERMNRNLLISQRNLSVLSETNDTAEELKLLQSFG